MADFLTAQRVALIDAAKAQVSDPVERYGKLKELLKLVAKDIKIAQAEVANELHDGRTWGQVGDLLGGVSGSRAEQISRASR
ncbi:hypothetical protein [Streptomyces sp. DW26H14]|uniref:hypothetical protein n=1 Tax=Streptomyces sp. DW26H14 TaxID=3435395 RepID=UPI00403E1A1C